MTSELANAGRFHFVHHTDQDHERKASRFQARAHTARVNRLRRRQKVHPTQHDEVESVGQRANEVAESSQICRTLSPVFGGFATDIFQPGTMPLSSRVLHYSTS